MDIIRTLIGLMMLAAMALGVAAFVMHFTMSCKCNEGFNYHTNDRKLQQSEHQMRYYAFNPHGVN